MKFWQGYGEDMARLWRSYGISSLVQSCQNTTVFGEVKLNEATCSQVNPNYSDHVRWISFNQDPTNKIRAIFFSNTI